MQVNNCTQPKPSFGMALKIKFDAVSSLKEMSKGDIERLDKAGKELKGSKFYDLLIGENGRRNIISSLDKNYNARSFIFHHPKENFLPYEATWEGAEIGNLKKGQRYHGSIEFANDESALRAYNDIVNSYYPIEKYTKIVKYLDAEAAAKQPESRKIAEMAEVGRMVDNLFKKYGIKRN